jgi:hypothetical protein
MERGTADAGDVQTTDAGDTANAGHDKAFTSMGFIPPVLGFPQGAEAQGTADIAFGVGKDGPIRKPSMPANMDEATLRAQAVKGDVERLLKTKDVTSPQDAQQALDLLLTADHQGQIIDGLDDKAFDNLLDRLPDNQLERIKSLVDASQNPKRKLRLWRAQHMATARNDLQKYKGDFGTEDEQDEKQEAAEAKYNRRKKGVDATSHEVDKESKKLLDKGDQLTVADIDKMRERKDKELEVEMKHNINLVAQDAPRRDPGDPYKIHETDPDVVWSRQEISQLDKGLDKLPKRHTEDANSVSTYMRKSNSYQDHKGGEYHVENQTIDVYDGANRELADRNYAPPVEYSVVHEVGHEVETENEATFAKFKKTAGWQQSTRADLEKQGVSEEELDTGDVRHHSQGKLITKQFGVDKYDVVDDTAIPSQDETKNERGKYSTNNAQEHWAEMYAQAVETPELLYADYIEGPAAKLKKVQADVADGKATQADLAHAQKMVKQRRELFDIIRNDVFRGEKETAAAVARLQQNGVGADALRAFKEKAARVSTPQQIEALEQQALRAR